MRGLAWTLAGIAVGLGLARAGLVIADYDAPATFAGVTQPEPGLSTAIGDGLLMAAFAVVGGLLAARRAVNAIGWLLLCVALSFGVLLFGERLGWHLLLEHGPSSARVQWAFWFANWAWVPAVVPMFIFVPLLFPTGRGFGRLGVGATVLGVVLVVADMLANPIENYPAIQSPLFSLDIATTVRNIAFPLLGLAALGAIISLARRFRHSAGVERQQIKWVWAGGAMLAVTFAVSALLQDLLPGASELIQFAGFLALPGAIAVAILRYRLYDIAVVINRTLVYGGLTVTLALVYLGSVLALQAVLRPGSGLAVAGSTLAVAAMFRPIRRRIQALVDRRFYRSKYDAEVALDAFSQRLRDEIDLDSLVGELNRALADTMQPAHVSVWLRPR